MSAAALLDGSQMHPTELVVAGAPELWSEYVVTGDWNRAEMLMRLVHAAKAARDEEAPA